MRTLDQLAGVNPVPTETVAQLVATLPAPPATDPVHRPRFRLRSVIMLAAIAVAVLVATPALALHRQIAETIKTFLASDAPPQAKTIIERIVRYANAGPGKPDTVKLVVSTTGPQGGLQLYALEYTNGNVGQTIVDTSDDPPEFRGGVASGLPRPLQPGQGLDVRGSGVQYPGRTPVYFSGVVDPAVTRVEVVYADGHTQPVPIANGYMLGWVLPHDGQYGDGQLIAQDANGSRIGRDDFCETHQNAVPDLEFRSHITNMPDQPQAACAIPPTPDPG